VDSSAKALAAACPLLTCLPLQQLAAYSAYESDVVVIVVLQHIKKNYFAQIT